MARFGSWGGGIPASIGGGQLAKGPNTKRRKSRLARLGGAPGLVARQARPAKVKSSRDRYEPCRPVRLRIGAAGRLPARGHGVAPMAEPAPMPEASAAPRARSRALMRRRHGWPHDRCRLVDRSGRVSAALPGKAASTRNGAGDPPARSAPPASRTETAGDSRLIRVVRLHQGRWSANPDAFPIAARLDRLLASDRSWLHPQRS